ncbi:MAG: hypothetical protein R3321_08600 [Nitrososphaeraceae archaeon]|nr:hypothetical protein [Nitrososphaeraceae archaeon]
MADINVKSAQHYLKLWEEDPGSFNSADWDIAYNDVSRAINQDPRNPELFILLGNLQEWKIFNVNDESNKEHQLSMALKNYRKAASLRPAWPFTWNHIVLVKYRLGEIDDEFNVALENSLNTGPWEPGVQQVAAEVGLRTWKMLDSGMREKIVRNIHRGLSLQPERIMKILKKYDRLYLVCYQGNNEPVISGYCGQDSVPPGKAFNSTQLKLSEQLKNP